MKWSEQYATGDNRIDDQHRMIFQMAEDFRAALDEGKGERVYEVTLQSLAAYVRTHFGYEERCMDQYACPVAEGNKKAHDKFVKVLAEFTQRYETRGFERPDAYELVDTIDRWLVDHICRIDVRLKEHVDKA